MPQSLSNIIVHTVFSTKNREPWLDSNIRPRMHAYLATICRDIDGEAMRLGGVSDHIHILSTLPRTVSQAKMIEHLKKTSSKWIKTIDARFRKFLVATRLRSFLRKPEPGRHGCAIRRQPAGASSLAYVSGRISRVAAQTRNSIRRTIRVGLTRAFSASFEILFILGRCPRLR
jgi:REP element-mobilizing transposase RayT